MALNGIIRAKKAGGGGGGYLNGVSGVIKSITFKAGNSGVAEKSGKSWTKYSGVITVLADGAENEVPQFADAGFLRGDQTISADNRTIEGDDAYFLSGNENPFGRFIVSLFEGEGNRLPESLWEATNGGRNYDALAGVRVTFQRVRDEEATKRMGKRKDPKTGKEYDRDYLLVSEVLAAPAPAAKGAKAAVKGAAKGAVKAAPAVASTDAADAALLSILGGTADNTLERSKVSGAVVRYALAQKLEQADREAIRKTLQDDAYIADAADRGLIVVDGEGKAASLTLTA